jgi:DNA-directed RNA polymerase specialized sigma24 family protein
VVLRHYFDLGEAATASELGIAPGTVKSTLSRALAKLRVSEDSLEEAVGQ